MIDAADAHDDVAQRDRDGGADDLLDDRGVDGQPRGDFGRAVFLEEARARGAAGCGAPPGGCRRRCARRARRRNRSGARWRAPCTTTSISRYSNQRAIIAVAATKPRSMISLKRVGHARASRPAATQQGERGGGDLRRVAARMAPDHARGWPGLCGFGGGRGGLAIAARPSSVAARASIARMRHGAVQHSLAGGAYWPHNR